MTYPNAAAGLKTVYQSQIVGLITMVLFPFVNILAAAALKTVYQSQIVGLIAMVLFPFVSILAVAALLVVFVLYMVGLNQCAKQDDGYRTAFTLVIINLVVNLLGNFIPLVVNLLGNSIPGAISTILSLVGDVLTLAALYFVCITTNRLLENLRAPQSTIDRGVVVWKINVICTIVTVVCTLLSMIPVVSLQLLASIVTLIATIAQLVGCILYMLFLRDAYRIMESVIPPEEQVQQMM